MDFSEAMDNLSKHLPKLVFVDSTVKDLTELDKTHPWFSRLRTDSVTPQTAIHVHNDPTLPAVMIHDSTSTMVGLLMINQEHLSIFDDMFGKALANVLDGASSSLVAFEFIQDLIQAFQVKGLLTI